MVTVLVTGGTGFVGSHIVRALIEAGHQVRVLRRNSSPTVLLDDLDPVRLEYRIGDVLDVPSLQRAMQGVDTVYHVAAASDYWRTSRAKLYLVNVNGTTNVLEGAQEANVRRVVVTSSAAAVGSRADGSPASESDQFNMSAAKFAYGHSKVLAEQECARFVAQGLNVVMLNPAVVSGPGDLNQITGSSVVEVARGRVPIYPQGGVTVIDVRDVAQAHVAAMERGTSGKRYLLGAEDWTHKMLMHVIADITGVRPPMIVISRQASGVLARTVGLLRRAGVELPINSDQVRLSAKNLYFNCRKAWLTFGEPKISIRQSLQDTYDWYVGQGVIKRIS